MEIKERKRMDVAFAFLLVAVGGAIGAVLRYAVILGTSDMDFPWAIFAINIIGCTLASFILFKNVDETTRVFFIVGLIGAFTTLSAFTNDTVAMLANQEYIKATFNVFLNVGICLIGAIIGRYLAITF